MNVNNALNLPKKKYGPNGIKIGNVLAKRFRQLHAPCQLKYNKKVHEIEVLATSHLTPRIFYEFAYTEVTKRKFSKNNLYPTLSKEKNQHGNFEIYFFSKAPNFKNAYDLLFENIVSEIKSLQLDIVQILLGKELTVRKKITLHELRSQLFNANLKHDYLACEYFPIIEEKEDFFIITITPCNKSISDPKLVTEEKDIFNLVFKEFLHFGLVSQYDSSLKKLEILKSSDESFDYINKIITRVGIKHYKNFKLRVEKPDNSNYHILLVSKHSKKDSNKKKAELIERNFIEDAKNNFYILKLGPHAREIAETLFNHFSEYGYSIFYNSHRKRIEVSKASNLLPSSLRDFLYTEELRKKYIVWRKFPIVHEKKTQQGNLHIYFSEAKPVPPKLKDFNENKKGIICSVLEALVSHGLVADFNFKNSNLTILNSSSLPLGIIYDALFYESEQCWHSYKKGGYVPIIEKTGHDSNVEIYFEPMKERYEQFYELKLVPIIETVFFTCKKLGYSLCYKTKMLEIATTSDLSPSVLRSLIYTNKLRKTYIDWGHFPIVHENKTTSGNFQITILDSKPRLPIELNKESRAEKDMMSAILEVLVTYGLDTTYDSETSTLTILNSTSLSCDFIFNILFFESAQCLASYQRAKKKPEINEKRNANGNIEICFDSESEYDFYVSSSEDSSLPNSDSGSSESLIGKDPKTY